MRNINRKTLTTSTIRAIKRKNEFLATVVSIWKEKSQQVECSLQKTKDKLPIAYYPLVL